MNGHFSIFTHIEWKLYNICSYWEVTFQYLQHIYRKHFSIHWYWLKTFQYKLILTGNFPICKHSDCTLFQYLLIFTENLQYKQPVYFLHCISSLCFSNLQLFGIFLICTTCLGLFIKGFNLLTDTWVCTSFIVIR